MKRSHWAFSAAVAAILGGAAVQGQDVPPDAGALFQRLDKNGDGKLTASEIPEDQARFFERLVRRGDKNSDGALTREEFEQANQPEERLNVGLGGGPGGDQGRVDPKQRFEMLDRNKDGKVTLEEFPEPMRERMKPLFDRLGKQELTLEEFSRFAGGPGMGRPEPSELFKRFDANADGKLSKDEIPAEQRERFAAAFERLGKNEMTREEFQQAMDRMREAGGRPMVPPEELFARLDTNGDGKLTIEEVPERMRPIVEAAFRRAGKERDGSLTKDEFAKNLPPRDGERPDGERPRGDQPRDGERRPEGDRPRDGERRPEGGRPRDAADAERPRDGEPHRGDADRPRETERRPEGDRPRDGQGRPEGDRGRDGGRPIEGRGSVLFRLLDTNRDGRLSKDELAKISDLFAELDRNGDGQLDPAELMGPGPDGRGQPREGEPRRDGVPREGERRPEGDAPGRDPRPGAVGGAFFQRLDRDGDGKISKDEAPDQMKERFSMLDTNGDGFISPDELRAGAQQLGDRIRGRQPEGRPEAPKRD